MTASVLASDGSTPSLDDMIPIVLRELREMARRQLAKEHGQSSLQTTDLVHEAYLRMASDTSVAAHGRAYFFAASARAMRHVLIDAARRRRANKRGGGLALMGLDDERHAHVNHVDVYADDLLDIDHALQELERHSPRHAQVVECRFFGGMTVEDTAHALDISPRTVKSDWAFARAWLARSLREGAA